LVNNVLRKNNMAMYAQECLGYKPDSTAHINQCIGNDADIIRGAAGRLDCDTARAVYLKKLIVASSGQPANYQIPRCSTLDPVIASINAQFAQLSQPGAAPVAIQNSAPAASRSQAAAPEPARARTQAAAQQPADSGAASRRRQAATQAAAPVQQPVARAEAVDETYDADTTTQQQTKVDEKLGKVNQSVEKSTATVNQTTDAVGQTANAVNNTVEQTKKLFGMFSKDKNKDKNKEQE
jgi:hypothetical protein